MANLPLMPVIVENRYTFQAVIVATFVASATNDMTA